MDPIIGSPLIIFVFGVAISMTMLAYFIVGLIRGYWELEDKVDQRINALEEELDAHRTKTATRMHELEERLRGTPPGS